MTSRRSRPSSTAELRSTGRYEALGNRKSNQQSLPSLVKVFLPAWRLPPGRIPHLGLEHIACEFDKRVSAVKGPIRQLRERSNTSISLDRRFIGGGSGSDDFSPEAECLLSHDLDCCLVARFTGGDKLCEPENLGGCPRQVSRLREQRPPKCRRGAIVVRRNLPVQLVVIRLPCRRNY